MSRRMSRKQKKYYRALCVLIALLVLLAAVYALSRTLRKIGETSSTASIPSSSDTASALDSSDLFSSSDTSSAEQTSSAPIISEPPVSSAPVVSEPPVSSTPVVSQSPTSSKTFPNENSGIYTGVTWRSPYAQTADIMKHGRNLMLLNNYYELPENFQWNLVLWSNGEPVDAMSLNSSQYDKIQAVDAAAYQPLKDLFSAAKSAGVPLQMVSAYRSINLQDRLFNSLVAKYASAGMAQTDAIKKANTARTFTGTSEHNTGYGFDILESGNWYLSEAFENTAQFKWLQQNAAEYGFILRYAKDKVSVTGIMYEPWHYRYVGVEAAQAIKSSGLCMEEYIAQLDNRAAH